MGSNTDGAKPGRALFFSASGYALGLAEGRLFGCPPAPGVLPVGTVAFGVAADVPDEQKARPRNEEDCHDA